MRNEQDNKSEQPIRFVAKKYREGSLDADVAWKQFAAEKGLNRRLPLRRWLAGAAAVLLMVIGVGTFYNMERNKPQWVVIASEAGQTKDIMLPDSSWITLAGSSEVSFDSKTYGKDVRAVKMRGKAFYRVMRDEAHPFSVQTEQTTVTVLGTSFQVSEQESLTEVYVESGKVAFAADETKRVVLTAGMSASYSMDGGQIEIKEEEKINALSWKTGELNFHDTPVDQVINDLNIHYQTTITNRTELTGDLKLTATFNDMPLEEVLFIINQTLDINLMVSSKTKE